MTPQKDMRGKAALIVAAMGKPQGEDGKGGGGDGSDDKEGKDAAKLDAAQSILAAIKNDDAHALTAALEDFCQLCDVDY